MTEPKDLVNELESYFLAQHRTYCEGIGREIKRQGRDDLKDVLGNWYKYCVDGKLSAKRYRVIKAKEPLVTAKTQTSADSAGSENPGANSEQQQQEQQAEQQGMFSSGVDWLATKIKNNRGLLGMIAGVGLTYAGQAVHNRYKVVTVRNRERRIGDVVGGNTTVDGNVNNPSSATGQ